MGNTLEKDKYKDNQYSKMSFYDKLKNKLENKLKSKELQKLPKTYYILGKILILKLDKSLIKHKKIIGKTILEILPYVHTVVLDKGIKGVKRKPKIEIIAGCRSTQTMHKEHGKQFLLDVSENMWSKGNKAERERMLKSIKQGEIIVDMFAGIGYWAIYVAEKAKKVYAIDINPKAIEYLRRNAYLNHVQSKIEILEGDCRKFASPLEGIADRIIIGYIYDTERFLPAALKIAKKHCIIHFHKNVAEKDILKVKKKLEKYGSVKFRKVKSYAPKIWHVVYDIRV
ncbi:MAG: class I SAM-dependent methyltransferase family protein [Candidatus Aenigmarchaeota archaeon]|nr:class I SAM-dependent methyltransferase family protein [Candidatus Aenigmarchaeota archaeon]